LRTINGICGVGWSLSAAGTIARTGQRGEPAGAFLPRENRFFLNLGGMAGGELFPKAAEDEYTTRHEQFLRIRAGRNASRTIIFDNWTVWDKSGVKYTFRDLTRDPHPAVLFLTEIESPTGQHIYYKYLLGTDTGFARSPGPNGESDSVLVAAGGNGYGIGTIYLESLRYPHSASPWSEIRFEYEQRGARGFTDDFLAYRGGRRVYTNQRLGNVNVN
jgi:hypothetical protein